jgi:uncharacterized RDD family membrane protein YckC
MQPGPGSQVVTGEAVALDLRPAAIPSRIVAGALDALFQVGLLIVMALVIGVSTGWTSDAGLAALSILTLVLVLIAYPVGFETVMRGRTPGKAVMGLRVVRDDGGPIGFRHALVRGLAGAFLERPGITFFVAGVLTSLLNSQSKRLGDLLAGTVVLQERVPSEGGALAVMPPPLAGWAADLDLSGLSDELALQARQFLSRADELTPAARDELGGRLVRAVSAAVSPAPPPGTPGWAVLSAVLAERRRREEVRLGRRRADAGRSGSGGPQPGDGAPPGYGAPAGSGAPAPAGASAHPAPPAGRPAHAAVSGEGQPTSQEPPQPGPGGFAVPS